MRLLVTRPAEDAAPFARTLEAAGHVVLCEPMLDIRPLPAGPLDLDAVAAVLLTSANGARALAAATDRRDLPVYAVGDRTAALARAAGFADVTSAAGDAAALARLIRAHRRPADGPLVHAAGLDRAGDLAGALTAAGFEVRVLPLYDAVPARAFSAPTRTALQDGALDGVLLMSPRTARQFARLLDQAGLASAAARLDAYCLSGEVASALDGTGFRAIHVAARPTSDSLVAALG